MPHESEPVQVVSPGTSLLDAAAVEKLVTDLEAAQQAGAVGVVLDMKTVSAVAADGLAALLHWATTRAPREQGVVLANAGRELTRAICQTRLQQELDVYATVQAARAASRS